MASFLYLTMKMQEVRVAELTTVRERIWKLTTASHSSFTMTDQLHVKDTKMLTSTPAAEKAL